jgi:hypothetical protein
MTPRRWSHVGWRARRRPPTSGTGDRSSAEYVHHLTKTTTQYGGAPSPSQFLLQWDDEGVERQPTLDLFDAFGTREKTLHANLGGHAGTPWFEVDDGARFFGRHLK